MYEVNSVGTLADSVPSVFNGGFAESATARDSESMVDNMKNIAKAKLRRQVMADPSLARELVAVESTAVYNSRGSLITALSSRELTV